MTQPLPSHWPRVWRGESSGELFDTFDLGKTDAQSGFFFAQDHALAQWYAGGDSQARAFIVDPGNTLDLQDAYHAFIQNAAVRALIDDLKAEFDEWIDRSSGEEGHPCDWLEAGTLYDYEGNGTGERWHTLFRLARRHGFDSVVLPDATSAMGRQAAITWVLFDPARILPDPERGLAHALQEPAGRRGARLGR
jgi:hypothetical protein